MGLVKKKSLMNSFFAAQFNNCMLVWMIHSRFNSTSFIIYMRVIYSDKTSSYEELLDKDQPVSNHQEVFQVDCEGSITFWARHNLGV